MCIRHTEAIIDDEYRTNYYSSHDVINNKGGLFLLRKNVIDNYGTRMLHMILNKINLNSIKIEGSQTVKIAENCVRQDASLIESFTALVKEFKPNDCEDLNKDYIVKLHYYIVEKVINTISKETIRQYDDLNSNRAEKNGGFRPALLWTCNRSKSAITSIENRSNNDGDENVI